MKLDLKCIQEIRCNVFELEFQESRRIRLHLKVAMSAAVECKYVLIK